jgi:hypothetical protein
MNPDTGEAETPVHGRALSWRRNLDHKIDQYERTLDRELDVEERIALMSPAEKDAALKALYMADPPRTPATMRDGDRLDFGPNRSFLMRRLTSGQPISRSEARNARWSG